MFLNIIMLFTVYVVLLIMYFAMRHMVFDDGKYLFGARKNSMMYDTEKNRDFIEGVKKKYIKDLNRITLLIAVGSLLPIVIPFVSIKTSGIGVLIRFPFDAVSTSEVTSFMCFSISFFFLPVTQNV